VQEWLKKLTKSLKSQSANKEHPFNKDPYALHAITVQAYDLFGGQRIGFLKLTAEVANDAGESLPASIFLRGPSVGMLVLLVPEDAPADTEEKYALLTVQPRIPAGSLSFVELPAGMVDDDGEFAGAAAREIKEELGLEIHESELVCLSELAGTDEERKAATDESGGGDGEEARLPLAMYPSPGACDEFITLYLHERRVPRDELKDWTGRLTGLREEGEKITLRLVPVKDLWRVGARDAKCLAALALWEGLKREGKL